MYQPLHMLLTTGRHQIITIPLQRRPIRHQHQRDQAIMDLSLEKLHFTLNPPQFHPKCALPWCHLASSLVFERLMVLATIWRTQCGARQTTDTVVF